ncbi:MULTISPECIES: hypothetical protein [unclassified Acidovorax]|uniref:hypothetical protein n=1 Tax=unclassified Acidovorax TaxID=2684926 RepID=UPI001C466B22|nr:MULTISPECIES: hypothetical protein [unclassified Acidovorax]MBV7428075.1 hypothetical protein [Acidovorax sp. sif0732]MBV7449332.1 hypothetical protein [Acidovorax sp. sif0715]
MPSSTRLFPRDVAAAASAWDHESAVWHAQQVIYWRRQLGHGPVPASRCAFHVHRHERRVVEIAERSLASLAKCIAHAGAAA